jgi:Tfp pilus assembly protein PilO
VAKAGDKKLIIILIVLFVVAFGVIAALCYYKWIDNKKTKDEIATVQSNIKVQEKEKQKIRPLERRRKERVEAINQLTRILPSEAETSHSRFLTLLSGFAMNSGVEVIMLDPPRELPDPSLRIVRYTYKLHLDGTYPQFVRFLNEVETHTRFLQVDTFDVSNLRTEPNYWPEDAKKKIVVEITTFTYNPGG